VKKIAPLVPGAEKFSNITITTTRKLTKNIKADGVAVEAYFGCVGSE